MCKIFAIHEDNSGILGTHSVTRVMEKLLIYKFFFTNCRKNVGEAAGANIGVLDLVRAVKAASELAMPSLFQNLLLQQVQLLLLLQLHQILQPPL